MCCIPVVNNNKTKSNIVLADTLVSDSWEFADGLREGSSEEWAVKGWNNAGLRKGRLSNLKRLAGYFIHPLGIFLKRKKYKNIVTWQQFYGLIFSFYCCIFHVKKVNRLIVMTFIYKEKPGRMGRVYKAFMNKIVSSGYIDRFIVFSKHEVDYYSELFKVSPEKFKFMPLGISEKRVSGKNTREANAKARKNLQKPFLLSVGRSNRDYPFLFRSVDGMAYQVIVLTDDIDINADKPPNVSIFNNIDGEDYFELLSECAAVLIPLKDTKISSGQLVMLQAMQYGKPFIVTESEAVKDYAKNFVNAIITAKNEQEFCASVLQLMEDEELRNNLGKNGINMFNKNFSLKALGRNVGGMPAVAGNID